MKSNWLIQTVTRLVLIMNIFSLLYILIKFPKLPPLVPLWYSRPWGADQLVSPLWLFMLPLGSMVWYLINVAISMYLTREYLIFTQMVFLSSFLVSFMSFVTLIKILSLITWSNGFCIAFSIGFCRNTERHSLGVTLGVAIPIGGRSEKAIPSRPYA